jgi:hypothetical protein
VDFSPTAWGWLTLAFGTIVLLSIFWRIRSPRRAASAILISSILLFLFAFMQWASWYK